MTQKPNNICIRGGGAFLLNALISPQNTVGQFFNHESMRNRKLLLHNKEICKLIGQTEQKGLTVIPLKMYFKRGWVKVAIALAGGKKVHDKRDSLKEKQDKRGVEQFMKTRDRD